MIFDEFLFYFLKVPFPGRQLARHFKTFQPWLPGTLQQDNRRQEHEAQQNCQREIQ